MIDNILLEFGGCFLDVPDFDFIKEIYLGKFTRCQRCEYLSGLNGAGQSAGIAGVEIDVSECLGHRLGLLETQICQTMVGLI